VYSRVLSKTLWVFEYQCNFLVHVYSVENIFVNLWQKQLIQQATEKITKNRTSIVIAHRLAAIKSVHKILVMDKGEIVEQGTHQELLQLPTGYYRKLYDVQFAKD